MKYTKETILRINGEHFGKAIWQIPLNKLLSIYYDNPIDDPLLMEYIKENLIAIKKALHEHSVKTRQCYKVKYVDRKQAKKAVKNPKSKAVDCYYCKICFHWHTTTKMNR
jgi:hypothetical protein